VHPTLAVAARCRQSTLRPRSGAGPGRVGPGATGRGRARMTGSCRTWSPGCRPTPSA